MNIKLRDHYIYAKHGLLWYVCCNIYTGCGWIEEKDSQWEDEVKAKEHCRLLNIERIGFGSMEEMIRNTLVVTVKK